MVVDTLAIVGVGFMGGSVGWAARVRGTARTIVGVDTHSTSLERARALGIIDSGTTDLDEAAARSELIVVCTPVDRTADRVLAAARSARAGTVVSDVASTKGTIVREVEPAMPAAVRFVGAHPLAGSEKQGPDHAQADLFVGRICVLTPTASTDRAALERVGQFWRSLGSDIRYLDPDDHDQILAATSHLPHLVAALLAAGLPDAWRDFAATGFRDMTRIASGDPDLWTAIALHNAPALTSALDRLADRLGELREAVRTRNADHLRRLLTEAKRMRDALGS